MFDLAFLLPLLPALAFALIVLFTNRSRRLSAWLAIGAMAVDFVIALAILLAALDDPAALADHPYFRFIEWLPNFQLGWMVDPLVAVTIAMVTLVCAMIFIYSQGYMGHDPRFSRFFAYISLFAAGMLGFVISNNLLEMFVFREIMGLCSYLLIGFWFYKPAAARAARDDR